MKNRALVLLTLDYPFGLGETFLHNEVKFLSKRFNRLFIIPSRKLHDNKRPLPNNVVVVEILCFEKRISVVKCLSILNYLLPLYIYTLIHSVNRLNYIKFYKSFIDYAYQDLIRLRPLKNFILKNGLCSAIFYDYWFVNSTLSLCYLRKNHIIKNIYSRIHGFDLYDERQYEGIISFREFKIKYLQRVLPISRHGEEYLKSRVSINHLYKINYYYLGVNKPKNFFIRKPMVNEYLTIVSCSRVFPVKRVDLIPKILAEIGMKIQWFHFGNGPEMDKVRRNCLELSPNISYKFFGEVSNDEVLEFYSNNWVDFFISVSESEGIPVSMMEAISFGIPLFTTLVGGVSEIVNEDTGIGFDVSLEVRSIAKLLEAGLKKEFDRNKIRYYFESNFHDEINYNKFYDFLIQDS